MVNSGLFILGLVRTRIQSAHDRARATNTMRIFAGGMPSPTYKIEGDGQLDRGKVRPRNFKEIIPAHHNRFREARRQRQPGYDLLSLLRQPRLESSAMAAIRLRGGEGLISHHRASLDGSYHGASSMPAA